MGVACVAWRFCRAGRTSGEAATFARENERQSREKNKNLNLLEVRGFSALALLYYLARPTKTAMLRRLAWRCVGASSFGWFIGLSINSGKTLEIARGEDNF